MSFYASVPKTWFILVPDREAAVRSMAYLQEESSETEVSKIVMFIEGCTHIRSRLLQWIESSPKILFCLITSPAPRPGTRWQELLAIPAQAQVWPLHAIEHELHDSLAKMSGTGQEIMSGLEHYRSLAARNDLSLYVRTLITADNFHVLPDLAVLLRRNHVNGWLWDLPVGQPLLLMSETQQRQFNSIAPYALAAGPPVLLPRNSGGRSDYRIFGEDSSSLAASSLGFYPANAECLVHEHILTVDMKNARLLTCPLSQDESSFASFTLGKGCVTRKWNETAFSQKRSAWCKTSSEHCITCQPFARRLHQDWIHSTLKTTSRAVANTTYSMTPIAGGGIILNWKCITKCAHCLFASDSHSSAPVENDTLNAMLKAIGPSLVGPRGLHISGGEPFLDLHRLEAAIIAFHTAGIRIEFVETNGFWAINSERARLTLARLREVGLQRIRLSVSPFHEIFVPLRVARNAYAIACDVFGNENVFVFDKSLLEAPRKGLVGFDLCSGGRAGYMAAARGLPRRSAATYCTPCSKHLFQSAHAHFDGAGNIIPSVCTGIRLGHYTDLPNLLRKVDVSRFPILRHLAVGGPASLWTYAKSEYGIKEPSDGFVGACHCCVDVRRRLFRKKRFQELGPTVFYDAMDRSAVGCVKQLRWDEAASQVM